METWTLWVLGWGGNRESAVRDGGRQFQPGGGRKLSEALISRYIRLIG